MRLAVISDTHLSAPDAWFQQVFAEHLARADVLIHCGDITGRAMLDFLRDHHPNFHAVAGNMCEPAAASELPATLRLTFEGRKVGVVHGWGDRESLPVRVREAFGPGFDLILFGHSHRQTEQVLDGALVVNPGSLTSGRSTPPGLAFVDVRQGALSVDFVQLPSPTSTHPERRTF